MYKILIKTKAAQSDVREGMTKNNLPYLSFVLILYFFYLFILATPHDIY